MTNALISPANASFLNIPGPVFFVLIPVLAVAAFTYIMVKRLAPLMRAQADPRFTWIPQRINKMVKYALLQWRHPRYLLAGVLHILLFAGFMILSLRSITLVVIGIKEGFVLPGLGGGLGDVYAVLKDMASTLVLIAALIAIVRRSVFKPERYAVPERYKVKDHTWEAILVLLLITILVVCDMLFEGSLAAAQVQKGFETEFILPGSGHWLAAHIFNNAPLAILQQLHLGSYILHDLTFFFFLCFLPNGKHFHVITSLPNVFLSELDRGSIKPVRWGVTDEELDALESFGVKKFEDFTWKHMLDFLHLCRLWTLFGQLPGQCRGKIAIPTVYLH